MNKNTDLQNLAGRVADRLTRRNDASLTEEQTSRPLVMEALEPRILFSGAPAPAPAPAPAEAPAAQEAPAPAPAPTSEAAAAPDAPEAEVALPSPAEISAPEATAPEAVAPGDGETAVILTDTEVSALADVAAGIWADSGLSADQSAALAGATYQIADLGTTVSSTVIGATEGVTITIDDDAAGRGWFVDGTPEDNSEFALDGSATTEESSSGIDLLSVVLHEQGHILGLLDVYGSENAGDIMNGVFVEGERRLPADGQAEGAVALSLDGIHYAHSGPATLTGIANGPSNNSRDSWNNGTNWSSGHVPSGSDSAIIPNSAFVDVWNTDSSGTANLTPSYSGGLTLGTNSSIQLGWGNPQQSNDIDALGSGTITMDDRSSINLRLAYRVDLPEINLAGDASIHLSPSTSAHHQTRDFVGEISGAGELTLTGNNNNTANIDFNNSSWSGGFVANADDSWRVEANTTGAFGTGDVTLNGRSNGDLARGVSLQIDAADVIDDGAALFLNGGRDHRKPAKLILNANETVAELWIDGVLQAPGNYDASSGLTTSNGDPLISGSGTLTVLAVDTRAPVPNPMTFSAVPHGVTTTSIEMTATEGIDATDPVEYQFRRDGGTPSAWQTDRTFSDSGLTPGQSYDYDVRARDAVGNVGDWSAISSSTPVIENIMTTDVSGGSDSWNAASNWTGGVPSGSDSAIIANNIFADVQNAPPNYVGNLVLGENATFQLRNVAAINVFPSGPSSITLNNGSTIDILDGSPDLGDIEISGSASMTLRGNGAHHETIDFNGIISGGAFTIDGVNNDTFNLNAANTFSGGLTVNAPANQGFRVKGTTDGAFGSGDVTINNKAAIYIDSGETIDDGATLSLNGVGSDKDSNRKLILNSDETVSGFFINGVDQGEGTFGAIGSGADTELAATILFGSGILTVPSSGPDNITWNVGDGVWDTTTPNWTGDDTIFSDDDNVTFDGAGGTVTVTQGMAPGTITVDSANDYTFETGVTPSGVPSSIASGDLIKNGSGTLQLGDDGLGQQFGPVANRNVYSNDFSSVTVNEGTLKYRSLDALGTGTVTMAGGTTLIQASVEGRYGFNNENLDNDFVLGAGMVNVPLAFGSESKSIWLAGDVSGDGGFHVTGSHRDLNFSGDNTFSGGVILESTSNSANNVTIGSYTGLGTGTFTASQTINTGTRGGLLAGEDLSGDAQNPNGVTNDVVITSGRYFNVSGSSNSNDLLLSGEISGDGTLRKHKNDSTVILAGTNIYTGGTVVDDGTLTVDGSLADATMSINAGSTVNGTGTVNFNIDGATTDLIDVNGGTLDISGLNVTIDPSGAGLTEEAYVLVDYADSGIITGTQFAGVAGAAGAGYDVDYNYAGGTQIALVQVNALIEDGVLKYDADDGEFNNLQVGLDSTGTNLVIKDLNGNAIDAVIGTGGGTNMLVVPLSTFTDVEIRTGDENDTVSVGNLGDAGTDPSTALGGGISIDGEGGFDDILYKGKGSVLAAGGSATFTAEEITFWVGSDLTTTDGDITATATGGIAEGGGNFQGVHLYGADLTTGGTGSITLEGEGGDTGNSNTGVLLTNGSTVTTNDGNIDIDGSGGGSGVAEKGVMVYSGSSLSAGGSGNLTIDGTAGAGSYQNDGVFFSSGTSASVEDGDMTITGTGNGSFGLGLGVSITGTTLSGTGAGNITVTGTSAATGGFNNVGVQLWATTVSTTGTGAGDGDVTISGVAGAGTANNMGLRLSRATITAGTGGSIDLDGQGGAGTGASNIGLQLSSGTTLTVSGTGAIALDGTGGAGTTNNDGIDLGTFTALNFADGGATITGAGTGTGGSQGITGTRATFTGTGSGALVLTGSSTATGSSNQGILLSSSTISNTGAVTMTGTGSTSGTGVYNTGISLSGTAITGSDLTFTGNGGTGTSLNEGFRMIGGSLTGVLELRGAANSGTTGVLNGGVYLQGADLSGAGTGAGIFGTGGGGTLLNHGINVIGTTYGGAYSGTAGDGNLSEAFKGVFLSLPIMAVADRSSRRQAEKGDISQAEKAVRALLGRIFENPTLLDGDENETLVLRNIGGQIAYDPIFSTSEDIGNAAETTGIRIASAPLGSRRVLLLNGEDDDGLTGVVAFVSGDGEIVSMTTLHHQVEVTVADFIEAIHQSAEAKTRWSSPGSIRPEASRLAEVNREISDLLELA